MVLPGMPEAGGLEDDATGATGLRGSGYARSQCKRGCKAMSTEYQAFLASKRVSARASGFEPRGLNGKLFPFQRDVVEWACQQGRAALWLDTGLGKTLCQLSWAEQVLRHSGGDVLILCPLAVAKQTGREAAKFGIECPVNVVRCQGDVKPGVSVTNYQMLNHFDASNFSGVAIDESDILANFSGATKKAILSAFRETLYKLDCSATPAPNDHREIGNHADCLGVMGSKEMLARWFINDAGQAGAYRLKEHGKATSGDGWQAGLSRSRDRAISGMMMERTPCHYSTSRTT